MNSIITDYVWPALQASAPYIITAAVLATTLKFVWKPVGFCVSVVRSLVKNMTPRAVLITSAVGGPLVAQHATENFSVFGLISAVLGTATIAAFAVLSEIKRVKKAKTDNFVLGTILDISNSLRLEVAKAKLMTKNGQDQIRIGDISSLASNIEICESKLTKTAMKIDPLQKRVRNDYDEYYEY